MAPGLKLLGFSFSTSVPNFMLSSKCARELKLAEARHARYRLENGTQHSRFELGGLADNPRARKSFCCTHPNFHRFPRVANTLSARNRHVICTEKTRMARTPPVEDTPGTRAGRRSVPAACYQRASYGSIASF